MRREFQRLRGGGLAAVLLLLGIPGIARADLITVDAGRDNTLIQVPSAADPQLSNGSGPTLFVGRNNSPAGLALRRGLIRFDLAGLVPAGSVITSVTLAMQLTNPNVNPDVVGLHRLLADWGEGASFAGGGGGAPAQPPDATWFYSHFDTRFWSAPGGDFVATASARTPVGAVGLYAWASTPALVADVQGWLDNPAGNFGWLLRGDETESQSAHGFATRESSTGAGPRLTVEFTPAVPEPASVTLFVVGVLGAGAFALRRRQSCS